MTFLKFLGVLTLGIVIGAGGLILVGIAYRGGIPASAADTYNACLQDAKIGSLEHSADWKWFDKAVAKCATQYRIDREHGR
jgi:hypothetical protein